MPTLLAGNGVLIKPAPSVPGPSRLLEQCLDEARSASVSGGSPPAPCHIALFDVDALDDIIADPRIAGVTLTGSERAGRHVAQVAGAHLKRVVLELGGSDPFIVLPSADVDRAAAVGVIARTVNSGQSCVAAKRFIVCDAVYDAFVTRSSAGMQALVVGDPRAESTPDESPAAREELFGPVAADPRYPFGGVKHSGIGRELGSLGFREFTNAKTVRTPSQQG